jgi:hypothetical protein
VTGCDAFISTDELRESFDARGAMVCDYGTFRSIYRLSARAAVRRECHSLIASIKIVGKDGSDDADNIDISNRIGAAISGALRRDDVVTGFDTTRYLILLSNLTEDDGVKVLRRLVNKIVGEIGGEITVETDIRPMEPAV